MKRIDCSMTTQTSCLITLRMGEKKSFGRIKSRKESQHWQKGVSEEKESEREGGRERELKKQSNI